MMLHTYPITKRNFQSIHFQKYFLNVLVIILHHIAAVARYVLSCTMAGFCEHGKELELP
jgi:hypothetical protein